MRLRRSVAGLAIGLAVIAALTAGGSRVPAPAMAQEAGETQPSAERLMRDIQFLDILRNLEVTAAQRREAASVIADFHDRRRAIEAMAQTEALIRALTAVRTQLLAGKAPTAQMREAVEGASPRDDGSTDRAFMAARQQVLGQLVGLLTDQQKTQLRMMPLVEFANHVVNTSIEVRGASAAELQEVRQGMSAEVGDRTSAIQGADVEATVAEFQTTVEQLLALPAEQVAAQRNQFVQQIVTTLSAPYAANPQAAEGMVAEQLWDWVTDPNIAVLLEESATAMGAE